MTKWQINNREDRLPLVDALQLRVPAAPRTLLRQLCKKQRVTVDGCQATAGQLVHAGQIITVRPSLGWRECLERSSLQPGQILYEDVQCLVVDKPAGLAVHRAHGRDDNLIKRVESFMDQRREAFRVAPVHRLDIGTSGAVLVGKGRAAISQLGRMIMAGLATKRYLAMVVGELDGEGELTSPVPSKGSARTALTRYRSITSSGDCTLLELELVTGRRHQIRRQLAEAGWPILGDSRYGGRSMPVPARVFLHCHQLIFPQPATGVRIAVSVPLPVELQEVMLAQGLLAGQSDRG